MRDRLLLYAVVISVFGHLGAMCVIGRTSASRLNNSSIAAPPRLIKVDLVKYPEEAVRQKPEPVSETALLPEPLEIPGGRYLSADPSHIRTLRGTPGNPGGALNLGTPSAHGDLPGTSSGGNTPVGWVPGGDNGPGMGSGNSAGVGTPDPPENVSEGPNTRPSPGPVLPPPPKNVSLKVCKVSGMLPGEHCKATQTRSFVEGKHPAGKCTRCKPPEYISTLADRTNPKLITDGKLQVPSSLDEGLTLRAIVEYWVETDGSVSGAKITKSSGSRSLNRAILSYVSGRKYEPAVQNGVPRRATMRQPLTIKT